ncbi:hypothetical protein V6S65_13015 [Lactococcus lactis]|uniref:hypothetical protein n=1 Tax=Lactococcus lactis TaxID=1358 RepID=UPI00264A880B|nr:hypothetical protein [Lactococcus lactis]MDN6641357.1 hypothetical protein [Tetragenococcus sp.]MDN6278869.1 hypothetical protein [Lactococcus lactis]MDN6473903.1 hypothetical protein [Lactococcus lactis]MDN6506781.1 hypothetical protein [Lactococcus lactis]
MTNRTRKEFAEYLKMDVKKLADKIRYLEKKHEINFGTNSEDTKIYTEQEQYEICNLLEIPTFHVSVHNEIENFLSELNREKIKNSFEQLSELISAIDNADFIKLDENFDEKLIKKLGRNFAYWYARKNGETKFNDYQWGFIKFSDVAEYYRELKENKEK